VSLAASRLLRRLPRSPAAPGTGRSRRRSCRSAAGPGILKSSVRQSCSPNARQVGARWSARSPPAWPAPVWTSAWPPRAPFQGAHHHLLHVGIGDRPRHPGRGSSPSPFSRLARNRARHLVTVLRLTPSRAATAMLLCPSALASTIRARNARSCAVLRRFAQFSNVCCSSCANTSGASTGSPILPAHCTPAAPSSSNQSAEAKGDSSGDRELKTGDTRRQRTPNPASTRHYHRHPPPHRRHRRAVMTTDMVVAPYAECGSPARIDGTLSRSAKSNATLASAPFPELPGCEGGESSDTGNGARRCRDGRMDGCIPPTSLRIGGAATCTRRSAGAAGRRRGFGSSRS
jgi:hypothetical protein